MTATYKSAQSPVRGCSYSQVSFVAMVFSVVSAAAVVTAVIVVDIVIVVCCLLYVVCCLIFRDFRKNLFSKFFFSNAWEDFRLSQPNVKTYNMQELHIFNFVYLLSFCEHHIFECVFNAFTARAIRINISFIISLSFAMLLPM